MTGGHDPGDDTGKVAALWDGNAAAWAEVIKGGGDTVRDVFNAPAFLSFVGALEGRRVLDAGCGEGRSSRDFAGRGAKVTGVDLSARMIALARREEARRPLGITFHQASFADMPALAEGSFDDVISMMALMDAPDLSAAVAAFFRVLRPGGRLAFSVIHPCFYPRGHAPIRDDAGRRVALAVSDYFLDESYVEHLRFPPRKGASDEVSIAVTRFPRTVSEIVNTVIAAGLRLDRLAEPRPSAAACRRLPWLSFWHRHGALYLYVRAIKPE